MLPRVRSFMAFEPISVYGNYFIAIDGEGIKNDYVLLDSSLSDYARLYTGQRLTTLQCLDWLYNLAWHAGYGVFVLYGAGYDFNNWMRDIPFADVKRLANSQMVRVGNYLVQWQPHFKFELRLIRDEDESKPEYSDKRYIYKHIKTRLGDEREDYIGIKFWDVLPWWQTSFENALDLTLKDGRAIERDLITAGKEARGTFTHDNIEWVSRYNKAECLNLAYMMCELDAWFKTVGIKPRYYNGPGSAAKFLLASNAPWMHAGRKIEHTATNISQKVREYIFPGADHAHSMLQRALSAYAGALNKQLQIGYHPGITYQYDIVSAYPYWMRNLPCLSHGEWRRTREFDSKAFGLWKVRYHASRTMPCYPFFWRTGNDTIEYPFAFGERWCHTSEVAAALAVDGAGVTVLDGWVWTPDICDDPYPFWWVTNLFAARKAYKAAGNEGASIGLKLPLNSLYGSVAQARGGTIGRPPWTQQLLWSGAITAATRTRLYLAHRLNPDATVHMATDGIISTEPLPLRIGDGLGDWEETQLTNLTVVQYGIYAAESCNCGKHPSTPWHHRERGFTLKDDEVPEFVRRVHEMWRTGTWQSLAIMQQLFVTCGLVAMSEKRYDEWCTWQQQQKLIELEQASIFKIGHVNGVPGMEAVRDASFSMKTLGASKAYTPKWGKGENFPREWYREDTIQEAMEVTA
jgi:hypothetical protein